MQMSAQSYRTWRIVATEQSWFDEQQVETFRPSTMVVGRPETEVSADGSGRSALTPTFTVALAASCMTGPGYVPLLPSTKLDKQETACNAAARHWSSIRRPNVTDKAKLDFNLCAKLCCSSRQICKFLSNSFGLDSCVIRQARLMAQSPGSAGRWLPRPPPKAITPTCSPLWD